MNELLKNYEKYRQGDLRKIGDFQLNLEMDEINRFKTMELKESQKELPSSAYNYMKVIERDLRKQNLNSNYQAKPVGFAYSQSEIESKICLSRKRFVAASQE